MKCVYRPCSSCAHLIYDSPPSCPPTNPPTVGDFLSADYSPPQLKEDDHFGSLLRTFPPPSFPPNLHLTDKTLASHVTAHRRTAVVFYMKCESASRNVRTSDLCTFIPHPYPHAHTHPPTHPHTHTPRVCKEPCFLASRYGSCGEAGPR